MLRMSVKNGEYIMVGDDVKIVFLGGGAGQAMLAQANQANQGVLSLLG